ncbi:MAG: peptidylprolyl isomerase, partial [Hyphomicrobiaceae bacterium]
MLEKLRRGATKVMIFALFSVLILSFAVWGIGDVIRSSGQGSVAEVGPASISAQELSYEIQHRRQMLARQLGQSLTPEQMRSFGLDAAVLGELVNRTAVSNHAKSLGLRLSDDEVAHLIRTDPAFHGPDNKFSRAVFDERMRQAGLTEQRYIAERRNGEVREQLTEAMALGVEPPDTLVGIVHRYREEMRKVAFIRLDPEKAKVGEPDEKAMKALYEEQKHSFSTPERRKIAVLLVTPEQIKDRAKVSDEEVRQAWEQARVAWDVPERRRIQQIAFKTKAEAEGEAKAIAGGKGFLMAALEANARGALDSGLIARREISDANFAKAAFELPLDKLSEPLQ